MPSKEQLGDPEPTFPLEVVFCEGCALVQILETVSPEVLFCDDYPYFSSFSDALLKHSRANVEELIERRSLGPNSLVIELASNDGYLLQYYQLRGIPVLGIDPAEGPAKKAREKGIPTEIAFFTKQFAQQLVDSGKKADVIHANNVLAHVADTNGFVSGMATLLNEDGVAVIEHPYVRDLVVSAGYSKAANPWWFATLLRWQIRHAKRCGIEAAERRTGTWIGPR
jgi:SAM-dependent methyltransferase